MTIDNSRPVGDSVSTRTEKVLEAVGGGPPTEVVASLINALAVAIVSLKSPTVSLEDVLETTILGLREETSRRASAFFPKLKH